MKFLAAMFIIAMLSGCGQQNVKDVLTNLDKDCARHYQGSVSTGGVGIGVPGATVTFTIDCLPGKPASGP